MKKNLFVLLMALSGYAFAQTADEIEVKKVVMAESDTRDDFEAWIDCYADSPQTSYTNTGSPGAAVYRKGFEEIKEAKKKSLAASPKSGFTLNSREDWVIRVVGDMAWGRHTQHFTILATNTKLTAFDLKVLEKINGKSRLPLGSVISKMRRHPCGQRIESPFFTIFSRWGNLHLFET